MIKVVQTGDVAEDIRRIIESLNRSEAILTFNACLEDATAGGAGTVTSVAGGVGITNSPEPITGAGTVDLDVNTLTTETALASGDLLPFLDVSVGVTPASQRKITVANLLAGLQTLGSLVDGAGAAGQVAFWSDANTLTGDSALFWDAPNNRLGINTVVPAFPIDVVGENVSSAIVSTRYDAAFGNAGAMVFRRARGSVAVPAALASGDVLGSFLFQGHNGSSFTTQSSLQSFTTEAWGAAKGCDLRFFTTPNGSVGIAERMRLDQSGNVLIGTTTDVAGSRLRVIGGDIETDNQLVSSIATGTAPLTVSSTTLVASLNADLLDGLDSAVAPTASSIVASNAAGTLDYNARLVVRKNSGADVGTRRRVNFIEGTNVTLTVADDAGSEEVDVTIAAAGGGGGGTVTSVAGGVGLTGTPDPITTTGVLDLDINALTTETAIAAGDLLAFVDVSVGTAPADQRKITVANLTAGLQPLDADLTELAAVANVRGDLLITNVTPAWARLAIGAAGRFLRSDGLDPSWQLLTEPDLPTLTSAQWAAHTTDETGTGALVFGTSPTLGGTPTIGNFTNAQHSHVLPFGGGQLDHGDALTAASLLDDDHVGYTRLAGRAGTTNDTILSTSASGTFSGSNQSSTVAAPRDLNIESTSHADKGQINLLSPAVTHSVTRTGTGTVSSVGAALIGTGTVFQDELSIGDTITAGGFTRHVGAISSQLALTLDRQFPSDLGAGTAFTYARPIHKFLDDAGVVRGFLTPDDYFILGATTINATNQANLSVTGTQPASVASGIGSEAPRVMFVQGAKGGNSTETGGNVAGAGGRFNLLAGAGGDHSGTSGGSGAGGAWTANAGAGGSVSAGDGTNFAGAGGGISFTAGAGGPVTGTSTSTLAGAGGQVTFSAGAGGSAIAGNTRGNGGNFTIRPGQAGGGAGAGGIAGAVRLCDLGGNVIVGSTTNNGERLGVAGDFALRQTNVGCANGNNDDLVIGSRSYIRLVGPTAAFATRGFANGTDGKLLIIDSTVNQAWTISNENAGSAAANRIYTGTGADLVLAAGTSAQDCARAVFHYDNTLQRWILLAARDATGPR